MIAGGSVSHSPRRFWQSSPVLPPSAVAGWLRAPRPARCRFFLPPPPNPKKPPAPPRRLPVSRLLSAHAVAKSLMDADVRREVNNPPPPLSFSSSPCPAPNSRGRDNGQHRAAAGTARRRGRAVRAPAAPPASPNLEEVDGGGGDTTPRLPHRGFFFFLGSGGWVLPFFPPHPSGLGAAGAGSPV